MKRIIIAIVSASFFLISQIVTAQPNAVDLGLSVKWASCNVGAHSPEEYGDYYAWGETTTKADYSWKTYKWGSYDTRTKYNGSAEYGKVDNKFSLDYSDDVARQKWGGEWRIPTDAEWTELRTQCTWTWTTMNGKNGYIVTSKKNSNSIFLPAAGYRYDTSLTRRGSGGSYWSSFLDTDSPLPKSLHFDSGKVYGYYYYFSRICGLSVRPVSE